MRIKCPGKMHFMSSLDQKSIFTVNRVSGRRKGTGLCMVDDSHRPYGTVWCMSFRLPRGSPGAIFICSLRELKRGMDAYCAGGCAGGWLCADPTLRTVREGWGTRQRPYGTPKRTCGIFFPHASTPRNKDRFLGTPVWRPALPVRCLRQLHAQDFNFEAAEVGVVVFADAIGEVDE